MSQKSNEFTAPSSQTSSCSVERKAITSLPPEIILEISRLVSGSQQCFTENTLNSGSTHFPNHLEPLLQFSSRWRHTLIGCHSLWTHLDLVTRDYEYGHLLLARAKNYIQRAGELPLSLHIFEFEEEEYDSLEVLDELTSLVDSIASRLATLYIRPDSDLHPFLYPILEHSLAKATPGTLTQLMVFNPMFADVDLARLPQIPSWLHSTSTRPDSPPEYQETLRLITTLRLHEWYYDWKSPLYHGLTELTLTFCYIYPSITETQLVGILGSSPLLRVLRLRLLIHEPPLDSSVLHPVTLEHLETLNLRMRFSQVACVLRLISPGPKALKMSISMDFKDQVLPFRRQDWNDLGDFLARSNVTRIHACNWATQPWVPDLLIRIPDLEVLSLNHKNCYHDVSPEYIAIDSNVRRRVDTVNFRSSIVDLGGLRRLLRRFDIHTLAFYQCNFRFNFRFGTGHSRGKEVGRELADICSAAQCKLIVSDDDSADV